MKKIILTLALMPFLGLTQQSEQLDINNINARINFIDGAFQNLSNSTAAFETPIGSNKNAIYAQGLWIGGQDINSQFKNSGTGLWSRTRFQRGMQQLIQRVWKVDKDSIDYHLANYTNGGYVAPLQFRAGQRMVT